MPTEVNRLVYRFEELSDKAKERAREWYREGGLYDKWWDHMLLHAPHWRFEALYFARALPVVAYHRVNPSSCFWPSAAGL